MDALELLKEDHKKVKKMLQELGSTTERGIKTRGKLSEQLKQELKIHETVEEEIFYPALRDRLKEDDIVLEGYEEHHAVDVLLHQIEGVPFNDETWGPKMKVIKENIEHHIEEEEGPMFAQARKVLKPEELEEIGSLMEERKSTVASR